MTTRHEVTGRELSNLLAVCPLEAYPSGVTEDENGNVLVADKPLDLKQNYSVWNCARDTKYLPTTIDTDWSVDLA